MSSDLISDINRPLQYLGPVVRRMTFDSNSFLLPNPGLWMGPYPAFRTWSTEDEGWFPLLHNMFASIALAIAFKKKYPDVCDETVVLMGILADNFLREVAPIEARVEMSFDFIFAGWRELQNLYYEDILDLIINNSDVDPTKAEGLARYLYAYVEHGINNNQAFVDFNYVHNPWIDAIILSGQVLEELLTDDEDSDDEEENDENQDNNNV